MSVAIIDYGSGNLHSAFKAVERAAREAGLTETITLTSDPDVVAKAERIILPGVGAFADCRAGLDAVPGLVAALNEAVQVKGRPFFGICVGMQLMATRGLENGETAGLDWIQGDVDAISPSDPDLKIPHMGWNTLDAVRAHPVFDGVATGPDGLHAYFVHSYGFRAASSADVVATTDYAGPITAVIAKDTMIGTQFHPEKSQAFGLALLANFLRWHP
ncbi:imidazole glycerol phosphate synthase subunit HisH [Beijerinckia sp. L45]|uniref:imidazole glycerol phosphate synthase subunit HisH n=1 Tax=Beijerinckia sp. L45 TaxID=1641855 RepID=UPI00131C5387|nr:imidazole glycerol phosphate synthase subunit HisH [Beijerinckia sp. L45]